MASPITTLILSLIIVSIFPFVFRYFFPEMFDFFSSMFGSVAAAPSNILVIRRSTLDTMVSFISTFISALISSTVISSILSFMVVQVFPKLFESFLSNMFDYSFPKMFDYFFSVPQRAPQDAPAIILATEKKISSKGKQSTLDQVCRCLIGEPEVGIIGLHCTEGVGKTTLVKLIDNEFCEESKCFEVVIWVGMSNKLSVEKIQEEIGRMIGFSDEPWKNKSHGAKAQDVSNTLFNKKFALLLDHIRLWMLTFEIEMTKEEILYLYSVKANPISSEIGSYGLALRLSQQKGEKSILWENTTSNQGWKDRWLYVGGAWDAPLVGSPHPTPSRFTTSRYLPKPKLPYLALPRIERAFSHPDCFVPVLIDLPELLESGFLHSLPDALESENKSKEGSSCEGDSSPEGEKSEEKRESSSLEATSPGERLFGIGFCYALYFLTFFFFLGVNTAFALMDSSAKLVDQEAFRKRLKSKMSQRVGLEPVPAECPPDKRVKHPAVWPTKTPSLKTEPIEEPVVDVNLDASVSVSPPSPPKRAPFNPTSDLKLAMRLLEEAFRGTKLFEGPSKVKVEPAEHFEGVKNLVETMTEILCPPVACATEEGSQLLTQYYKALKSPHSSVDEWHFEKAACDLQEREAQEARDREVNTLRASLKAFEKRASDLVSELSDTKSRVLGLVLKLGAKEEERLDAVCLANDAKNETKKLAGEKAELKQALEVREGEIDRLRGEITRLEDKLIDSSIKSLKTIRKILAEAYPSVDIEDVSTRFISAVTASM